MNKSDLVTAVAAQADLTKEKADAAVSAMIEQITNALSRDEAVALVGFGSFSVSFKPGKALKDAVNV